MGEQQSRLEDLLVDEEALSEEVLFNTLADYLRIGEQSGELIFQDEFQSLNVKRKTTVILLAQRALKELDIAESEWLSPSAISDISGIKKGTLYPTVRSLDEQGIVEDNDGSYRVPSRSFERAQAFIRGDNNE